MMNQGYDDFMGQRNRNPGGVPNFANMRCRLNYRQCKGLRSMQRFPQLGHSCMSSHDVRLRHTYQSHFRQGQEKQWFPFGYKRHFATPMICNKNNAKLQPTGFKDRKQFLPMPSQDIHKDKYLQPHFYEHTRMCNMDHESHRIPSESNFNAPESTCKTGLFAPTWHPPIVQATDQKDNSSLQMHLLNPAKIHDVVAAGNVADDAGIDNSDSVVAVGLEPDLSVQQNDSHSREKLNEIPMCEEEEYEPEKPNINVQYAVQRLKLNKIVSPSLSVDCYHHMANCDDEGFHEAFVGVCISRYPFGLGRLIEVAGYGVWFSDGHKGNFSGVLNPDRPQNTKAVMIHGSARTIENMKKEGYARIRINLETEYLNKNVLDWISKYMENSNASPSNWDEVKYHPEIIELCNSATGMIIKWSHCSDVSMKKNGIENAKQLAKEAADNWMKAHRLRQEAVGTSQ